MIQPGQQEGASFKLFVGQIPRHLSEEGLREKFAQYGEIVDVHILRDKETELSRGCGFVTFTSFEEGQKAVEALHDKVTMDGMTRPMQVKWADNSGFASHDEVQDDTIRLFIGSLPKEWKEADVRALIGEVIPESEVVHVFIMHEATGESKGAGFATVSKPDYASQVIAALHDVRTLEGMSRALQVRVADSDQGKISSKLFVGQIGHTTEEQLNRIFSEYGEIHTIDVVAKSGVPQGCAFVHFKQRQSASTAINSLDGKFKILDAKQPLVVRFAETQKEKTRRVSQQAHRRSAPQQFVPQDPRYMNLFMQQQQPQQAYGANQWQPQQGGRGGAGGPRGAGSTAKGPDGANLFVGGLPPEWGDANLAAAFSQFGTIISAKVFMDKRTMTSKNFGFVSYDSAISAQNAIATMHGSVVGDGIRLKVSLKSENRGGGGFNGGGGGGGFNPGVGLPMGQGLQQMGMQQAISMYQPQAAPFGFGYTTPQM